MGRKVWEFVRWSVAAFVVYALGISHAPLLGTAVVWCALAITYLAEDANG